MHASKSRPVWLWLFLQVFLRALVDPAEALMTSSGARHHHRRLVVQTPTTTTSRRNVNSHPFILFARASRQWRDSSFSDGSGSGSGDGRQFDELSRQLSTDRPVLRQTQVLGPPIMPAKPKIVVLGASGRIGRLVVRQLLDMRSFDCTVVACVRQYDKACKVLYDDLSLASSGNKKGPRLTIVEADLVPPEELPGYLDQDEEEEWQERAESAAEFYNASISDYDNRQDAPVVVDANEALQEAIQDCTTIISCVGSVRPTNIWRDIMARPFTRWLRPDVSAWCKDPRHPYYVQFVSTRKILGYAEREQLKRETAVEVALEEESETRDEAIVVPKIRYIRVSDNCVSQPVWEMIPLITNICRSMVFRYHDMAERLLDSSTLIDTVTLRPGDLVDDERDSTTTHLQVDPSGEVGTPAVVSREDVASLAVASALFKSPREREAVNDFTIAAARGDSSSSSEAAGGGGSQTQQHQPFHCRLAVRWVGKDMLPFPPQGSKSDGSPNARVALQRALKTIKQNEKKQRQLKTRQQRQREASPAYMALRESYPETVLRLVENFQLQRASKTRLKPYGIATAIPVYFLLAIVMRSLGMMVWKVLRNTPTARPLVGPIENVATMLLAILASNVRIFRLFLSQWVPRGIARFLAPQQYISF